MNYVSRFICAGCGERVDKHKHRWWAVAGGYAHRSCRISCSICEQGITEPPLGKAHTISIWLGKPVHSSCKEQAQQELAGGEPEELEEARGWADEPQRARPRRGGPRLVDIGRISHQDGRSQDGRFQSKPDPS